MSLLTVTESFADFSTGHPEVYNAGRLVESDDPVVRGREAHFEPADITASRVRVESATAAPGERRTRSAPKAKKAPAKKAVPAKKAAAKKAPAAKKAAPAPDPETKSED